MIRRRRRGGRTRRRRGGKITRRRRGGKSRRIGGKRRRRAGKSTTRKRRGGFFYKKCFVNAQCKAGQTCDHVWIPFGIRYGVGDGTCANKS